MRNSLLTLLLFLTTIAHGRADVPERFGRTERLFNAKQAAEQESRWFQGRWWDEGGIELCIAAGVFAAALVLFGIWLGRKWNRTDSRVDKNLASEDETEIQDRNLPDER